MGLSLREIRENTTAARELLARARAQKFALGSFSLDNQESLKAVARAAVTKKSPVLVGVSHAEAESIGIENVRDMVDNYKRELGIEIFLNLDHAPSVEAAITGIENGFEFIGFDASQINPDSTIEEITEKTNMVVTYARLTGAIVESEPPYFAAGSKKFDYEQARKLFSTAEKARHFVDNTGIDIYAASIGNLHRAYPAPRVLDIDLLGRIRQTLDCAISLHGGSGTPAHYFKDAVRSGVSIVNIDSEMRTAFRSSLEKSLLDNPDELPLSKLMDEVISAVQAIVEDKIDMLGSANKAGSSS